MGYRGRRTGPRWGRIVLALGVGAVVIAAGSLAVGIRPPALRPGTTPTPLPSPTPTPETAEPLLARGAELLKQGKWVDAARSYGKAARLQPSAAAEIGWAQALLFHNQVEQGLKHAERAAELDRANGEIQTVLALARNWNGQTDDAIAAARRATELNPAGARAQAYLAEGFADKYRLAEADAALSRALRDDSADPEVQRVKGYLAESKADYPSAVAAYRQAVQLAPDLSYLHLTLGNAYRAQKQYDDALQAYQRSAELDPDDARSLAAIGSVHFALEEYTSAIKQYERAAELDPDYATPPGQIGWIHYVQKDYEQARPYLEKAAGLERGPKRKAQYLHALGWINLKAGDKQAARENFQTALDLDPDLQGAREGLQAVDS